MRKNECEKCDKKENSHHGAMYRSLYAMLDLLVCGALFFGALEFGLPSEFSPDAVTESAGAVSENVSAETERTTSIDNGEYEYTAKLFGAIPAKKMTPSFPEGLELIPSGDVFGVKFFTEGLVVTGLSEVESETGIASPAEKAGIKAGDIILSVGKRDINTVEEFSKLLKEADGKALDVGFRRDGKKYRAKIYPAKALSDGTYKAGMWVRDSTAGIGTVTFYDPDTGAFAGLGHGIYDSDTGLLMPLLSASVVDVSLSDIIKGHDGHPGELKGDFGCEKRGELFGNTSCGVFGRLDRAPSDITGKMPVASKREVKTGQASVLCNIDGEGIKEYGAEIKRIYTGSEKTKNFVVEITDEKLLSVTGGIIRGMSGSPILQDGKLIGAVTHVLVGDPHRGYGIFIENMIRAAEEDLH